MRWFTSLVLLSILQYYCFTAAYRKDVTSHYKKTVPYVIYFTEPVPIESNGVQVIIFSLGFLYTVNSVIIDGDSGSNPSKYTVTAEYKNLALYADCTGRNKKKNFSYDARVELRNFKYKVTFEKKQNKYNVLAGSESPDVSAVKVVAFVARHISRVREEDLAFAVKIRLIRIDKTSHLLEQIEDGLNRSFLKYALE